MDLVIILLALFGVWTGWRVFRVDSMVRASFALMLSFIATAGIGLLLSAPYIGVATVFMMAVEMLVMAIFMVMFMMNPAGLNPMSMVHQHRLSIGAGVVAFAGLGAAVLLSDLPDSPVAPGTDVVAQLGFELLGPSMLIFETAGVTLLATMLGAVILSSRQGRFGMADHGSRPPGLEPGGAPAGRRPEKGGGHGHGHGGHGGHGDGGHGGASDDHGGEHRGHMSDGDHEGHAGYSPDGAMGAPGPEHGATHRTPAKSEHGGEHRTAHGPGHAPQDQKAADAPQEDAAPNADPHAHHRKGTGHDGDDT